MNKSTWEMKMLLLAAAIAILFAGCASADGGAVVGGILQGVGAGLSGL